MTTANPIESHELHSLRLLDHAAEALAQGDRLQTSEKIWGAAVHRIKQIAAERNWPNDSHTDGWSIVNYLRRQTNNRRIAELFAVANDAHQNFYEDRLQIEALEERLEDVRELLGLLDDAHRTLPLDLPMPDDRHYRRRHDLP